MNDPICWLENRCITSWISLGFKEDAATVPKCHFLYQTSDCAPMWCVGTGDTLLRPPTIAPVWALQSDHIHPGPVLSVSSIQHLGWHWTFLQTICTHLALLLTYEGHLFPSFNIWVERFELSLVWFIFIETFRPSSIQPQSLGQCPV